MPNPKKDKTLAGGLLAAQAAIGAIGKDGHNDFSNYDYVTAETMIARSRAVLIDQGIVLTAGNVELIPFSDDALIVRQTMVIRFEGALDGETTITRDWPAVVQKGRPLDKAVAGALTAGLSYMLRDLLLIPRGDEPGAGLDHSRSDEQVAQATTSQREYAIRTDPEVRTVTPRAGGKPICPACGSKVWDNRDSATGSQPLWSCSNKGKCPGGKGAFTWGSWNANEFGQEEEFDGFEDGLDDPQEPEISEPIPF